MPLDNSPLDLSNTSGEWYTLLRYGWEHETAFFLPAATYTAVQILVAVTLYDFWLDDVLPLTCCPMFMPPRNLCAPPRPPLPSLLRARRVCARRSRCLLSCAGGTRCPSGGR